MQHGSLAMVSRKDGPAVWQFRWSEKDLCGARVQRKRVIGTLERYPNEAAARSAVAVLLTELNADKLRMGARSITVAQLYDHFEQRELAKDNTWRSYATKKTYQAYLNGFFLTGGSTNWLRSEQYKSNLGFEACLWRKAVVPKSEISCPFFSTTPADTICSTATQSTSSARVRSAAEPQQS